MLLANLAMLNKLKGLFGLEEKRELYLRPLKERDIQDVLSIERQAYNFPWNEAIFKDCIRAGYSNWALIKNEQFIGYAIVSIAAGEAHLLNICVNRQYQSQGLGGEFLKKLFVVAKEKKAACLFLEVRPSNRSAVQAYKKIGFKQIGERKDYYPTADGREDALVFSFDLSLNAI